MAFVYIVFVWIIAMIIYNIWKSKEEKKQPMEQANGRYKW